MPPVFCEIESLREAVVFALSPSEGLIPKKCFEPDLCILEGSKSREAAMPPVFFRIESRVPRKDYNMLK